MNLKLAVYIVLVTFAVVLAAGCLDNSAQATITADPVAATWIEPQVIENTAAIPVQTIYENMNSHFKVETTAGEIAVMAYRLGDDIVIRSNVCPPCGSIGFSLAKDILVCDSCRTTFDAATGQGIQGACVDYPKENIPYTVSDGNVIIEINDIVVAHMNTIQRG
ncbi:Fe-S-containing protein [Methanococcoides sp. AM1]|uniref:Fe-S-containing protein n=1 Tax=Methanococcoides sp. AM1 TaxID=1201011 RepID=UPI00108422EA|nr:Fe-S-containing protein [Methanococcoides sp. AM1]